MFDLNIARRILPVNTKNAIKRLLNLPLTRLHPDWRALRHIGPVDHSHVVLDVGAHHGWFFHCWQDWCPQAHVHAFEPTPTSFEEMAALYGQDPRVSALIIVPAKTR